MFSIVHPLVRKVDFEYEVLHSIIADLPNHYKSEVEEIERIAKEDAETVAEGDDVVFRSVYGSYYPAMEFVSSIPENTRCYLLIAIFTYYERNVRNVYKYLGIKDYHKASLSTETVFNLCNIPANQHQSLFDEISCFKLIRNNLSHGRLNNEDEWSMLIDYVNESPFLDFEDEIVVIEDGAFLCIELDLVNSFFRTVFSSNREFETKIV